MPSPVNKIKPKPTRSRRADKQDGERKKICWIGCGGTIAMERGPDGTLRSGDLLHLERLRDSVPRVRDIADLYLLDLWNEDSVNMTPAYWTALAQEIHKRKNDYAAFVITQGTDTMVYTAGALALAFGPALDKPIVLTGSQMPITEFGSDAPFNVENAFRTALDAVKQHIVEVMIAFGDSVYRGCRARKRSEVDMNAFHSPVYPPLAAIQKDIVFSGYARTTSDIAADSTFNPGFEAGVLHVRLTPGLDPAHVREACLSKKVCGVILESFGAGNVPGPAAGKYNFNPVIKTLKKKNTPVVVTTSFVGGRTRMEIYETGANAVKAGAIPAYDMTTEMAAVKLMWLRHQTDNFNVIKNRMVEPIVGEMTSCSPNKQAKDDREL